MNTATDTVQLAKELRDDGMERAVEHADDTHRNWSDRALDAVMAFAGRVGSGAQLTSEAVRLCAHEAGLPPPPDMRSWGAVMQRAARIGVIKKVGYTQATDPKVHCNPVTLWEVK